MSEDQNGFRSRIYAQRHSCIDRRCHHEISESDQLYCQPEMLGAQSRNTAWLPRYGCIAKR